MMARDHHDGQEVVDSQEGDGVVRGEKGCGPAFGTPPPIKFYTNFTIIGHDDIPYFLKKNNKYILHLCCMLCCLVFYLAFISINSNS